jgi:MFS family permease
VRCVDHEYRAARRVQACVVALMVSFGLMSYFDRTIMSIAGPDIIKEFDLSETGMGSVYSAFVLSYAVVMIPGGHLADRFGPRLVLTLVGFGAALFTGLTALGGRPGFGIYIGVVPALFAIRLGLGACSAPLFPTCGTMSANWLPPNKRALVWGMIPAGAPLGAALSPLLFSWMIGRYGWRSSFCQAAAATAVLTLVWLWYVRDHPAEHPSVGPFASRLLNGAGGVQPSTRFGATPWRQLLTDRNLVLLTLGYLTVGYFENVFYYWVYYYLGTIREMSRAQTVTGTTAIFLTVTAMTPLGGWISDCLGGKYGRKAGRRLVPLVALMSGALLVYLGTLSLSSNTAVILFSLALGLVGTTEGPFWASAIDLGGREVGAACGIMNTGANVGGFLGPLLTPMIASYAGWSWALYFGCAVVLVGALVWFLIDPFGTGHAGVQPTASLESDLIGK